MEPPVPPLLFVTLFDDIVFPPWVTVSDDADSCRANARWSLGCRCPPSLVSVPACSDGLFTLLLLSSLFINSTVPPLPLPLLRTRRHRHCCRCSVVTVTSACRCCAGAGQLRPCCLCSNAVATAVHLPPSVLPLRDPEELAVAVPALPPAKAPSMPLTPGFAITNSTTGWDFPPLQ